MIYFTLYISTEEYKGWNLGRIVEEMEGPYYIQSELKPIFRRLSFDYNENFLKYFKTEREAIQFLKTHFGKVKRIESIGYCKSCFVPA